MKLTSLATAIAAVSIPATTVLGDRHAHAPAEALAAMVARRDASIAQHQQHHDMLASKRHAHHHSKRGSCPARLRKQKVLQQQDQDQGDAGNSAPAAPAATPKKEKEQAAPKQEQNNGSDSKKEESTPAPAPAPAAPAPAPAQEQPKQEAQPKKEEQPKQEEQPPKQEEQPKSNNGGGKGGALGGYGLFGFSDKTCGSSGATEEVTKTTGPNGSMDFLNCGLYGNGWTPPTLSLDNILAMPLDEALEDPNTPYGNCRPFVGQFDKYGAEFGLPPILLAAIAMQESSCRPEITGGGGELGLMQITKEKCSAGIDCKDPDYNIRTGAQYLRGRLDSNNGNLLLALGQYNGWYNGLTVAKATAIKSVCCGCQDLNYFTKLLNGWLLNKDGSQLGDWDKGC